jgi:hypothetical protein
MGARFFYRDPNPAMSALRRQKITSSTANKISIEVLAALDGIHRGTGPNRLANVLIEHVGAAQVIWAARADKPKYDQALRAWNLLAKRSLAAPDERLTLDDATYLEVKATVRMYLQCLPKFTNGELSDAVETVKRMV